MSGIPSGFIDIDKKLGGLQNSDLIILAGRPSMGKTALATNIAYNASIANYKKYGTASSVGFFSLEMSSAQLATRILSDISKIPSEQIRRGELSENEFNQFVDAARSLNQSKFFIDDTPALLISSISSKARRLKRTHGLDFLIIDYLQLIRASSNKENRVNNQMRKSGHWIFASNIDEIFPDADAILILTEWEEYTNIDWERISIKMRRPAWIFDARSISNEVILIWPVGWKDLGLMMPPISRVSSCPFSR